MIDVKNKIKVKAKQFLPAVTAVSMLFAIMAGCKKEKDPIQDNPNPNPTETPTQNDSVPSGPTTDTVVPTPPTPEPDPIPTDTVDPIHPTDTIVPTPPTPEPGDTLDPISPTPEPGDTLEPTPPAPYVPRTHVIVFDWRNNGGLPHDDTVRKYANEHWCDTIILRSEPVNQYVGGGWVPLVYHLAREDLQRQLDYVRNIHKYAMGDGPVYVNRWWGAHLPNNYEIIEGVNTPGMSIEDSTWYAENGFSILRSPDKSSNAENIKHPCVPKGPTMGWNAALKMSRGR